MTQYVRQVAADALRAHPLAFGLLAFGSALVVGLVRLLSMLQALQQ